MKASGTLRWNHGLRHVPGAAQRAARLPAPRDLPSMVLQLRHLQRPSELVGGGAEAAAGGGAARTEPRLGVGLEDAPAGDARAAARVESLLQQRALGERPLQLDARLRSKVAFGAYRSA